MMSQLEKAYQWFIDGTFSVAPAGFQQFITIVVYLDDFRIFYPTCYILATNKSEFLYKHMFHNLMSLTKEEGFKLKPKLIMTDFERGLQNTVNSVFEKVEIVGCYFHYVKALFKKTKQIEQVPKKGCSDQVRILISSLKILVQCSSDQQKEFYQKIEKLYDNYGSAYKTFLTYYRKELATYRFPRSVN